MQSYQNALALENNSVDNYLATSKELQKELDYFATTIRKEMKRLGLENEDEIKKLKQELQNKEHIEKRINQFDKEQHKYNVEIERLTRLTSEKELEDISNLEMQKNISKKNIISMLMMLYQYNIKLRRMMKNLQK